MKVNSMIYIKLEYKSHLLKNSCTNGRTEIYIYIYLVLVILFPILSN